MSGPRGSAPRRRSAHAPTLWLILGALGAALFVVPLVGLLLRTPWNRLPDLLASPVVIDALRLSVVTSLSATALSAVLGIPLAWLLARGEFPGKGLLLSLIHI